MKNSSSSLLALPPLGNDGDIQCMLFHQAVATRLGLSTNEHRCIIFLLHKPQTPSSLAKMMGMTTSALTTLVDRLQKSGYVERKPDATDRRQVFVHATVSCREAVQVLFRSLSVAHEKLMNQYSPEQRRVIEDFMIHSASITNAEAERLRPR